MKNRRAWIGFLTGFATLSAIGTLSSCGRIDTSDVSGDGSPPSKASVLIGTQCPYGSISNPVNAKMKLWDCPMQVDALELAEPIQPLFVSADCKKKTLSIRTADLSIDTFWQVMPDGSFYVTVDGINVQLKNDGSGNTGCTTPVSIDFLGRFHCEDRDRVEIEFQDIIFWLGKDAPPTPRPSHSPAPNPIPSNPTSPPTNAPSPVPSPSPEPSPVPPTIPPTDGGGGGNPSPDPVPPPSTILFLGPQRAPSLSVRSLGFAPRCRIPNGCYLHTKAQLPQCL